ncbi:MAG: hypothetical protein LBJ40_00580 [Delftia acidovorans]|jgi:hypothetical protein|nr:hypothetical protein [Delftia acidovorans]
MLQTQTFPRLPSTLRPLLLCSLLASLHACGGGSGGGTDNTGGGTGGTGGTTPQPALSLSGTVVIDQAVRNALVCVDLNANSACDTGEPAAAATAGNGQYSLSYQPADAAATAAFQQAPVIARIGTESVDAADAGSSATTRAFVLAAPAGKAGQINPLTTLVQAGIAGGMARDAAEAAVARQLGVDAARIYDYQADAPSSSAVLPDTARTAAKVTAYSLELGVSPQVVAAGAAPTASRQLAYLGYTSADNYVVRERQSDGVVQADGYARLFETRSGKTSGQSTSQEALFPSVTLTRDGWMRCDASAPRLTTQGTPSRTLSCNQSTAFLGFVFQTRDLGGLSMAEAVTQLRSGDATLQSQGIRLDPSMDMDPAALGSAVFPAGSQLRTTLSVQLNRSPAYINNTTTDRLGFATLDALIAGRPASAVNLATPATVRASTVGSAGPVDAGHVLRVAFIDGANAQFYACESTPPAYSDLGACTPHSQRAYTVFTSQGVRMLSFADYPGLAFTSGVARGYTEFDGSVFGFRVPAAITSEDQALSYSSRLNSTAWTAMKAVLGVE